MDDKKKSSLEKSEATNSPIKSFVRDDVSAGIFSRSANVGGTDRIFYSISFSRSYRDSKGERQYVKTFNPEDLIKVVAVAKDADEYIRSLA